jgi:hypothetical protein
MAVVQRIELNPRALIAKGGDPSKTSIVIGGNYMNLIDLLDEYQEARKAGQDNEHLLGILEKIRLKAETWKTKQGGTKSKAVRAAAVEEVLVAARDEAARLRAPVAVAKPAEARERREEGPVTAQSIVEKLVVASESCGAGVRVLKLDDADHSWVDSLKGEELEWATRLRQQDAQAGQVLSLALNDFRKLKPEGLAADLAASFARPPEGLVTGGDTCTGWAAATAGSCGEMAAADSIKWARTIATATGVSWGSFEGRLAVAAARGEEEQKKWEALRVKVARAMAGDLTLPDEAVKQAGYVDVEDANKYLRSLYNLNREKPVVVLAPFWNVQRVPFAELWHEEDADHKLVTWDEVRRGLKGPAKKKEITLKPRAKGLQGRA